MEQPLQAFLMRRSEPLPLEVVYRIGMDVAAGLAHLHSVGILHLDLKPDNLLLDTLGVAKISDFGTARRKMRSYLTNSSFGGGTLVYMAPEVSHGAHAGQRARLCWSQCWRSPPASAKCCAPALQHSLQCFNAAGRISDKADIYSLGVLLWTVFTREVS